MAKLKIDILKDKEMGRELKEYLQAHIDKQSSAAEQDLLINADKVIYVLSRALTRLNLMAYFPALLEHGAKRLESYVSEAELCHILEVLNNSFGTSFKLTLDKNEDNDKYVEYKDTISHVKRPIGETTLRSDNPVQDANVAQIVDILFKSKCAYAYSKSHPPHATYDRSIMNFIKAMEEFKAAAKLILYESGDERDIKEKKLRAACKDNVGLKDVISELTDHLQQQQSEFRSKIDGKLKTLEMYNTKILDSHEAFNTKKLEILQQSEKEMMKHCNEREITLAELMEQADKCTQQYENLLSENLSNEKKTMTRRSKILTQLQNWLQKFDQDIGDRQAEFEALQKEFDVKKAELDELQTKFDDLQDEYEILMEEKEEEAQKLYDEVAYQMLLHRSARKIQTSWRAYLERKKRRRGKGKGKGKKEKPAPEKQMVAVRQDDLNAMLEKGTKKFKADVFEDLQNPNAFSAPPPTD